MANSDRFLTDNAAAVPHAAYPPPSCPKCGSRDTSSAAKRPTAASYWRCLNCGGVWSPAYASAPSRAKY
jgi:transposase-like protein